MVNQEDIILFRQLISAEDIDTIRLKNLFDKYNIKMTPTKNRCYSYRDLKHQLKPVHIEVEAQKSEKAKSEKALNKLNKMTKKSTSEQLSLKTKREKLATQIIELNNSILELLKAQ